MSPEEKSKAFEKLLNYYKECFSLVDSFHFNSDVSRNVYENNLGTLLGVTLPITHRGIQDHRMPKIFSYDGLVIGFIGNDTAYKGLGILRKSIEELNVELMVWGGKKKEYGHVHYRGKFQKSQMARVYQEMDLLVVPSACKETFSLVTLEALSYGVPVLVSDNVGAQVIVKEYNPKFVYHSEKELKEMIKLLVNDKALLIDYNKKILSLHWAHDALTHAQELIDIFYD